MQKKKIEIWTDGGARGNPGPAAIGVVVKENGKIFYEINRFIGAATNNQAEYEAVITALDYLRSQKINSMNASVTFYLDSELVGHQLNGHYRVKHANMKPLFAKVQKFCQEIGQIHFHIVPRSQNKRADELVNEALDNLPRIKH